MQGLDFLGRIGLFQESLAEQREALADFWAKADRVLAGSGVRLSPLLAARIKRRSTLYLSPYRVVKAL